MPTRRTEEQISDIMRRVKSEDTTPETKFRKALWARGVRYRLHDSRLPGKPDIVIPKARLAIFIDGDYWHGNQWRTRGHPSLEAQFVASPKAQYWIGKIGRNISRDRRNTARLLEAGWRVIRFWESSITSDLDACIELTLKAIEKLPIPSPASRLPEQSIAAFLVPTPVCRAIENRGWSISDGIDDVRDLSGAEIPPVSLWAAFLPATEDGCAASQIYARFPKLVLGAERRRPPLLLLCVTTDWLNNGKGRQLAQLLDGISSAGYTCDPLVLGSATSQEGSLYIVCALDELPRLTREDVTPGPSLLRARCLADFISEHQEIRWRFERLPDPPPAEVDDAAAIGWILENYLEPAINGWIHGIALG